MGPAEVREEGVGDGPLSEWFQENSAPSLISETARGSEESEGQPDISEESAEDGDLAQSD